jgi:Xaa-Pro aminopeptidase
MDTHDSSTVPHDLPLREGVALTIEPGLYIPDMDEFGPYRGIGIRLEDDVVITKSGQAEVLSRDAPLHPDDLAHLMSKC